MLLLSLTNIHLSNSSPPLRYSVMMIISLKLSNASTNFIIWGLDIFFKIPISFKTFCFWSLFLNLPKTKHSDTKINLFYCFNLTCLEAKVFPDSQCSTFQSNCYFENNIKTKYKLKIFLISHLVNCSKFASTTFSNSLSNMQIHFHIRKYVLMPCIAQCSLHKEQD